MYYFKLEKTTWKIPKVTLQKEIEFGNDLYVIIHKVISPFCNVEFYTTHIF